jgi:NhaA family Na+:H+ antiporter
VSQQRVFLGRLALPQRSWVLDQLRSETVGGVLLLAAAGIALVWANSPWGDAYANLVDFQIGPAAINLNLSVGTWAADGLLALFFFIVGLELKHELVLGSLSRPAQAAVPIAAAIGGMVVPAAIYAGVNLFALQGPAAGPFADGSAPASLAGWGVPMATDIAFALAVLAVVGRRLPVALRAFLLTLAVVDDLGAIAVIAIFYTDAITLGWLVAALLCCLGYWLLQRRRVSTPLAYVPLALIAWFCMHESGVHATVTGVILGLLTRIRTDPREATSPGDRLSHRLHPISAGICVPIFAFTAAGVDLRAIGLGAALAAPIAIGIMAGLVIGKPIGVLGTAWLVARFTRASLPESIKWRDVGAIGTLAGIGFTVALLIAELGFEDVPEQLDSAKIAILAASAVAAVLASGLLLARNRAYASIAAVEEADEDGDGIPDVYQR